MESIGRALIFGGIAIMVIGVVVVLMSKFGIQKVPGDIVIRRGNFTLHFPIVTSIVLSILLSLLFALFRR